MLSLALLRPRSRQRAPVVATATAGPLPPQRFGPDRRLELGGRACAVASGSAGGELLRLRGLFDAGTLDALLAAARSSMRFETDADTVDGSATYHASIIEAGAPVDATLAALLAPVLETRLLPYLRAQYACPEIVVADALVRRYRPEERPALSAHYDVAACATVIVPLVEVRIRARARARARARVRVRVWVWVRVSVNNLTLTLTRRVSTPAGCTCRGGRAWPRAGWWGWSVGRCCCTSP